MKGARGCREVDERNSLGRNVWMSAYECVDKNADKQEGNSVTHDELEVELRKLPPRERARLSAALLDSLEELSEDENARL